MCDSVFTYPSVAPLRSRFELDGWNRTSVMSSLWLSTNDRTGFDGFLMSHSSSSESVPLSSVPATNMLWPKSRDKNGSFRAFDTSTTFRD
ncbi:hypothetical protein OGAPHI_005858 [Ogataea philodendri]|uniref:Uncharacterized protein n=1 Tax=Ogataea philodendri TaxID=1378263 RepID=A0A9P8P0E4_9ASCO|nr:uncharacterized protein OGAPHI_005858 [Ogataea philodendri]KAH3662606.1 hypothetical protein OGAPHI_005858 [Ogataea philodendri]